ncbi:MAG: LysR family transcriptional regulator, partial [Blautia sp.]|nr:LysR family transcriptional regulator [Blautia sp.]
MLYEKLDYILAIAEEQSLTRAAEKLYISQPTLTMYLNRLEESLGVQLFDRHKKPIQVTAAGNYYIQKMKEISEAEQILRGELHTFHEASTTFRIGSAWVRGHLWLPQMVAEFSKAHPYTNITIVQNAEKQLQKLLRNNAVDMIIAASADNAMDDFPHERRRLSYERTILVAHKSFHLVPEEIREENSPDNPYPVDPQKLHHLPFIAPPSTTGMYVAFQKMNATYRLQPARFIVVDSMMTGLMMAAMGLGVQMISAGLLITLPSDEMRRNLDYCQLPDFPLERSCYVSWRKDTNKLPLIEEAFHILQEKVIP